MKLSDWAKKQGIAYLTAYRWFKDNRLPVKAYQSDSGTIIVEDEYDFLEQTMVSNSTSNNDVMSLFLKKTVEFSKNNSSIEDFAAWILSNFSLKINYGPENPKYSKNKPKSEDIQKHFQQFIKPKGEKPKVNMFVAEPDKIDDLVAKADNMTAQELVEEIHTFSDADNKASDLTVPELSDLFKDIKIYDSPGAEGLVSRNVDLNSTPQQINYTSSTTQDQPFGAYSYNNINVNASGGLPFAGSSTFVMTSNTLGLPVNLNTTAASTMFPGETYTSVYSGQVLSESTNETSSTEVNAFKPTQKELASAKVLESVPTAPKRRGRKPFKNIKGNK